MNHKDIKRDAGCWKGMKEIAARICIKLHAPLVHMLNQEVRMLRSEAENLRETVKKINRQLEGYEGLVENVRNTNRQLEGYEGLVENVQNTNCQLEGYEGLVENVRNTNRQLEGYEGLVENVRNTNRQLEGYGHLAEDVRNIAVNLRNNNMRLESIDSTVDMYGIKIAGLQKTIKQNQASMASMDATEDGAASTVYKNGNEEETSYDGIDYFDFENHFRGSRAQIKKSQEIYLKYFTGKGYVLDLGCGRGEFLELLKENGIQGYGVDLYREFVDLCMEKQLQAVQADAVAFLEQETEVDGIFAGQLIEHLPLPQLVRLTEAAYEKLKAGSYLVLETPNPMSLAIYTNSFYIDPSHKKPVHPLTMKYLLEKAGFRKIDIMFTESSRIPVTIPELEIKNAEGIAGFNAAMQKVGETLFGSQDYAIIAKK